ncbi:MAG: diguanylate cyclase [Veillonellaceae bacterium]|nr:diguanylate cyclase [Veillonellaceae bacterium]
MKRIAGGLVFLALTFLLLWPATAAVASVRPAEILILHSYHYELAWSRELQRGIETAIAQAGLMANFQTEFMDARRFESSQYNAMLADLYAAKFQRRRFDVLMVTDNNALDFMLQYRDRLFPGVPVVFCGINDFHASMLKGAADITGVVETLDFADTLSVALKLHPQIKNVYVFGDNSLSYFAIQRDLLAVAPKFSDWIAFRFYHSERLEDAVEIVRQLGAADMVLMVSALRNRRNEFVSFEATTTALASAGQTPVYGVWSFLLGHGLIGGKLADGRTHGEAAGAIAARILRGEDPARIPVVMQSPNQYMFDYRQLERFHLREDSLPPGSVLINRPPTTYMIEKTWALAGLALTLFGILVAAGAFLLARRWRQMSRRLNQENSYLNSLHEMSLGLLNRLDLEDVLETIVQRAAELVDTRHGFLFLHNAEKDVLELRVGAGFYRDAVGLCLKRGESISGQIWLTGKAMYDNHFMQSPWRVTDPRFSTVRATLNVPLLRGGEVVGVIGVVYTEPGQQFSEREVALVSRFAEQAMIALDNAGLYRQVQAELQERKLYEKKLRFLSSHDAMTGLLNRRCLDEDLEQLSRRTEGNIAVLVSDVDGLKLLNDTFGHAQGDRLLAAVARILQECMPAQGNVYRTGGDEFAILVPDIRREELESIYRCIHERIAHNNQQDPTLFISLSVGYAIGDGRADSLAETLKQADNNMYREKLHRSRSARSAMVHTVMQMMSERDFITEEHAERLQDWVVELAQRVGVSEEKYFDLRLFAQFHDIGKVGIADSILKKAGPLTADEMEDMKRHCEIGHRIAQSSPELAPIADWVLKHQERWDGMGYPFGLAGEKIPLECRILALVDAYDAMTSDRPYRRAMGHDAAVAELRRSAGTQFDPHLTRLFLDFLAEIKPDKK